MKRRIGVFLTIVFIVAVGAFTVYAKNVNNTFKSNVNELSEISAIMYMIESQFVDSNPEKNYDVNRDVLLEGAIKGMVESLGDPHSNYFTKEEMKAFTEDIEGMCTLWSLRSI